MGATVTSTGRTTFSLIVDQTISMHPRLDLELLSDEVNGLARKRSGDLFSRNLQTPSKDGSKIWIIGWRAGAGAG